jgi:chorismate synthase (EC 4.2.3.5)
MVMGLVQSLMDSPAGIKIDLERVQSELNRRAARGNPLATPRKEGDQIEVLSGIFNGKTTGAPLAGLIRNENTRSGDYAKTKDLMRPGHADYTADARYGGFQDYRGGGHFSGPADGTSGFCRGHCQRDV